jgi:hypothetical protein
LTLLETGQELTFRPPDEAIERWKMESETAGSQA